MDPKNLHQLAHWPSQDIVFCLAADDDGSTLYLGSSDANVYVFDTATEKPQRTALGGEGHQSYVTSMVRCGKTLITGGYDRRLIWWDLETRQAIRSIQAHDKWIRRLAVTPDQRRVVSVGDDMRCHVWDAVSGESLADFSDHDATTPHHYPSMLYAVAVSPDGTKLATGDRVGHVALWDAESYRKIGEFEAPVMYTWDPKQRRHSIGGIRSLAFSRDSKQLAVGGIGKIGNIDHLGGPARLEVFDVASGERRLEIEDTKKKGLVEQIVWSPGNDWILTAGGDHNMFLTFHDATSGERIHQDGNGGHAHGLVHNEDFSKIFVAGHQRVSCWSLESNDG
jgi:WD40 repeat protein